MSDINAWIAERAALAKAATPGEWERHGRFVDSGNVIVAETNWNGQEGGDDARHIAAWSPAQVERVLAVVRAAAAAAKAMLLCGSDNLSIWVQAKIDLDAALAALAGGEP